MTSDSDPREGGGSVMTNDVSEANIMTRTR